MHTVRTGLKNGASMVNAGLKNGASLVNAGLKKLFSGSSPQNVPVYIATISTVALKAGNLLADIEETLPCQLLPCDPVPKAGFEQDA